MKILVTGASGYVGKAFVALAQSEGHSVVPASRVDWLYHPELFFLEDIDAVVHLAAAGVKRQGRDWNECMKVNFHHLMRLLVAIQSSGFAPKIFLAGTEHEENMTHMLELWNDPYAVSKRLGSLFAHEWKPSYRGEVIYGIIFRCTGEGQDKQMAEQILRELEA